LYKTPLAKISVKLSYMSIHFKCIARKRCRRISDPNADCMVPAGRSSHWTHRYDMLPCTGLFLHGGR